MVLKCRENLSVSLSPSVWSSFWITSFGDWAEHIFSSVHTDALDFLELISGHAIVLLYSLLSMCVFGMDRGESVDMHADRSVQQIQILFTKQISHSLLEYRCCALILFGCVARHLCCHQFPCFDSHGYMNIQSGLFRICVLEL